MSGELSLRDQDDLEQAPARADEHPELVVPGTGEIIKLDDPAQVAHGLGRVREAKRGLDELRALLEALLRVESQRVGTKTVHLENGLTAVVSGGTRTVYDAETARARSRGGRPSRGAAG